MKKATRILVPLMLGLLILASIVWYLFVYDRAFTRDTLLSQARFHDLHGNARISAWCYDLAYGFSGHDENVAIELSNQYKNSGNYTKAEATLASAINNEPTAELYTALSKVFVEQDKLLDAVNLLDKISNPDIKAKVDTLRPSAPAADYEAGYYSQYMDIHLSSPGSAIYYTIDGDYPSTSGPVYGGSISLPTGQTTVYAISVNDSGLVSPVTVLSYTITGIIEEVTFTDPAMESAIRQLINADEDDTVYTNELWEITEFTVPEGVSNYSDLSLMPYLKTLTAANQNLDTLSHLSTLAKLETLDLTGSRFPVDDLSILSTLPALTNLTLVEINLKHNAVTNLTSLSSLANLEKLDVSYNSLTTMSPIGSCIKLTWLAADNNQLENLQGVDTLPLLSYLSVDYNNLDNVIRLEACTELTDLSIASNDLTDISCLKSLTKLKILDFSGNQVSALPEWPDGCPLQTIDGSYNALESIDSLKNMQSLSHIYMDYNLLTNIDALADCFCLVQVNVYGNAIPNVSALRDHDIIVNYDPTVTE